MFVAKFFFGEIPRFLLHNYSLIIILEMQENRNNNTTNVTFVRIASAEETREAIQRNNEILLSAEKPDRPATIPTIEECEQARVRNREALALANSITTQQPTIVLLYKQYNICYLHILMFNCLLSNIVCNIQNYGTTFLFIYLIDTFL